MLDVKTDPIAELRARIAYTESGCWLWTGVRVHGGYGQATYKGRRYQAHRLVYTLVVGDIAADLQLDHLCRNRACVNPEHLEQVTNRENVQRGLVASANRTICKAGQHDITSRESLYIDSEGHSRCRECRAQSRRRWRQRAAKRTPGG